MLKTKRRITRKLANRRTPRKNVVNNKLVSFWAHAYVSHVSLVSSVVLLIHQHRRVLLSLRILDFGFNAMAVVVVCTQKEKLGAYASLRVASPSSKD
jgi:hypothetical protein